MSHVRTWIRVSSAVVGSAAVVAMGVLGSTGAPHVAAWMVSPPSPMTVGRTTTDVETTAMPAKAAPTVKAPHR